MNHGPRMVMVIMRESQACAIIEMLRADTRKYPQHCPWNERLVEKFLQREDVSRPLAQREEK